MKELDKSQENLGSEMPQRMRHCFMTGKQCILQATISGGLDTSREQNNVFVVMPFRPNLDTFFEWSLKRYFIHFGYQERMIHRADQVRDIGYVMCQKICRRIQDASLIAIDLSVENPNVYYEFGIAIGLNKKFVFLCDKDIKTNYEKSVLCKSLQIPTEKVIFYPGVDILDAKHVKIEEYTIQIKLPSRKPEMKVVALLHEDPSISDLNTKDSSSSDLNTKDSSSSALNPNDIPVSFKSTLTAAVGVAFADIEAKAKSNENEELTETVNTLEKNMEHLRTCKPLDLHSKENSYEKIEEEVNSAFACIIDLANENPLSYFWLGYCHARNINVIPIYRDYQSKEIKSTNTTQNPTVAESESTSKETRGHVLAFDIRALWYIHYSDKEPKYLANTLRAVFEELLVKDVRTQERRIFWERLTRTGKVHIYTGAVHHSDLNREVVGDWDLRTVSELVRYLSSGEESVVPVLERPVYAPETIEEKLKGTERTGNYTEEYIKLITKELSDKNCLIVASADVNPLTEVVLAYAYAKNGNSAHCFCEPDTEGSNDARVIVALKGTKTEKENSSIKKEFLPRFFSRNEKPEDDTPLPWNKRGFLVDNKAMLCDYKSQDEAVAPFSLLAHLMVVRNPFSPNDTKNIIVLLNGVSGPGSFGLAEMLTGGTKREQIRKSEALLREINKKWAEFLEKGSTMPCKGIEAIIEVSISPPKSDENQVEESLTKVKDKFYDKREVSGWDFYQPEKDATIRGGNPRPFPF